MTTVGIHFTPGQREILRRLLNQEIRQVSLVEEFLPGSDAEYLQDLEEILEKLE